MKFDSYLVRLAVAGLFAFGFDADAEPLFQKADIPGITDYTASTNGMVLADVNRDGMMDVVAATQRVGEGAKMKMFLNRGNLVFEEQSLTFIRPSFDTASWGIIEIPNLADFNNDGILDIYLTREGGAGNIFLLSQGNFYTFEDVSDQMGARNAPSANHGQDFGDVNGDGWLDIGVGAGMWGDLIGGPPNRALFVYQPGGADFKDGFYVNIGGTDLLPEFGGAYAQDTSIDKGSQNITLRDLDNDGDLDLLQNYETDCDGSVQVDDPDFPGHYPFGMFVWKNLLKETGEFRYERVEDNGLAEEARFVRNPATGSWETLGWAVNMTYISTADVDNNGYPDVLTGGLFRNQCGVTSAWPEVTAKFWYNQGGFSFRAATEEAGLEPVSWYYQEWADWFGVDINMPHRQFFARGGVFGDFDNDGWVDMVTLDSRSSSDPDQAANLRNILFMNNGDGTFRPVHFDSSGLLDGSITAVARDLNGDGLLDLYQAADPPNSSPSRDFPDERYRDDVYINTGALGGRENNWLHISRFTGVTDAELIGARVFVYDAGTAGEVGAVPLGMRIVLSSNHAKSGEALDAHFGLGRKSMVDVKVVLMSGDAFVFENMQVNRSLSLDLSSGAVAANAGQAKAAPGLTFTIRQTGIGAEVTGFTHHSGWLEAVLRGADGKERWSGKKFSGAGRFSFIIEMGTRTGWARDRGVYYLELKNRDASAVGAFAIIN